MDSVASVLESGQYILGPQTKQFEDDFARFCEAEHGVGVANGTEAITLALLASGVGPGDEVITVSHTAVATVAAIELAGATPVLVDVEADTYTMDPALLDEVLTSKTKAVIPVHIYGHPCQMDLIDQWCRDQSVTLIEDCAQAHGATFQNKKVGSFGDSATFSFYPTKNLGGVGDGGMILTSSSSLANKLKQLRQYGWNDQRESDGVGWNSRLDEIQAAILRVRLSNLEVEIEERRSTASQYRALLCDLPITLPTERADARHAYHLFVIQAEQRDELIDHLKNKEIHCGIHYPLPVHMQKAYNKRLKTSESMRNTEALASNIVSLPLYPGITQDQIQAVAESVNHFYRSK